jgi:hypothetical protein
MTRLLHERIRSRQTSFVMGYILNIGEPATHESKHDTQPFPSGQEIWSWHERERTLYEHKTKDEVSALAPVSADAG